MNNAFSNSSIFDAQDIIPFVIKQCCLLSAHISKCFYRHFHNSLNTYFPYFSIISSFILSLKLKFLKRQTLMNIMVSSPHCATTLFSFNHENKVNLGEDRGGRQEKNPFLRIYINFREFWDYSRAQQNLFPATLYAHHILPASLAITGLLVRQFVQGRLQLSWEKDVEYVSKILHYIIKNNRRVTRSSRRKAEE